MEFLGPTFLGWDGSSQLPRLVKDDIKKLATEKLIVSYGAANSTNYTRNFGRDLSSHLRNRHLKFGMTDSSSVTEHFSKLPRKVPAFLISHYIKVFCGALNSDGGRRRFIDPDSSVHPGKGDSNPFPCYLCNLGSVADPGDCSRHLFGSCSVVRNVWDSIICGPGGPNDIGLANFFAKKTTPLFIPDYPIADPAFGYCRLSLIMTLCWAIHKTINQIKMGRDPLGADHRAVALTLSLKSIWCTG
jgi:hypothetical protein